MSSLVLEKHIRILLLSTKLLESMTMSAHLAGRTGTHAIRKSYWKYRPARNPFAC